MRAKAMPRVLEMREIDGKLAVFLDMPTEDEGSVSLWTEAEKDAALRGEREACAMIAEEWARREDVMTDTAFIPGADHGERFASAGIAEAIRARK